MQEGNRRGYWEGEGDVQAGSTVGEEVRTQKVKMYFIDARA